MEQKLKCGCVASVSLLDTN